MTLPITTEHLILRRFTYNDIPDIIETVTQTSVTRITSNIEPNEPGVKKFIDEKNSYHAFEKEKYFYLAIERKEDKKVMGLLSLMYGDHKQGAIGWSLGVSFRGKGYASEGAKALMKYAFTVLGGIFLPYTSDSTFSI